MTPERFRTIVDAYGADPRRWPADERADAQDWARRHRADAHAALADATELDTWLARHAVAPPGRALVERIVASAPAHVHAPSRRRVWWSGAALAGAGLAGALAGALAMSIVVVGSAPSATHESAYLTTSFGGPSADWSDE
ncbi:hypothetical protein [Burkholderia guangdongensis]|uniref:hypothetical protein n=1 Tax=Burkholderia guangdongensis TaxID=1792500 RepID=UPI0015CBDEBE|nr:hypothetical protein [Burkholderia guangdongensis]